MLITPSFRDQEFDCHDGTPYPLTKISDGTLHRLCLQLEEIRAHVNATESRKALRVNPIPLYVMSGYRTPEHNGKVGGAEKSRHVEGDAADIQIPGYEPLDIFRVIMELRQQGRLREIGGIGVYRRHVHIDCRTGPALIVWRG